MMDEYLILDNVDDDVMETIEKERLGILIILHFEMLVKKKQKQFLNPQEHTGQVFFRLSSRV